MTGCGGGCALLFAASRVPVKRYSILTVALFPDPKTLLKEVDVATGELQKSAFKRIGNLIEYAEKNPHRIPKIARRLERRLQKEVRALVSNEGRGSQSSKDLDGACAR
jgi:hypothetical protein